MPNNSFNTKRIVKNTFFLYFRMLFLMVVTLYTSRVVLDKLGVEDFGIHNVVAGFVSMLAFFSSSLSNVTQRFLNIELGNDNFERASQVFNQHLILYVCITIAIVILAETVGLYFVKNKLVIPSERMRAALWAYQFAIMSLIFTLWGIVYNSEIIAHEDMKIYSFVGIFEGGAKLLIAFLISFFEYDRLIFYSFMLMCVVIMTQLFYAIYCHRKYQECNFFWYWDKSTIKTTTSFISWNFLGTFFYMLKDQGVNMLLNMFYGPAVNAARAVSLQVSNAVNQFNNNFFTAVRPQIVKSYAAGERDYMLQLFFNSTKYSLFLMFFLCLPIMLYAQQILGLWLKEVPKYTAEFTVFVLIDVLLASISNAPWSITMATGNLKKYVLWSSGVLFFTFPFSYIALTMGVSPVMVFVIMVLVRFVQTLSILWVLNTNIHYGINNLLNKTIMPFIKIVVPSVFLSMAIKYYIETSNIFMLLICMMLICTMVAISIWLFGTSIVEKKMIKQYILSNIKRK